MDADTVAALSGFLTEKEKWKGKERKPEDKQVDAVIEGMVEASRAITKHLDTLKLNPLQKAVALQVSSAFVLAQHPQVTTAFNLIMGKLGEFMREIHGVDMSAVAPMKSETVIEIRVKKLLFSPGETKVSDALMDKGDPNYVFQCLAKHVAGEWGDHIEEADKAINQRHAEEGKGKIFSVYPLSEEDTENLLFIITNAEQTKTDIILQEEYNE